MIIVDASALLEALLRSPTGLRIERRLFEARDSIHAPHLIDLEVTQVLRRYATAREIDSRRAQEALDDLAAFHIHRYPHAFLVPRIWELRQNLTAYDAAYVGLAEALDAPLVTRDRKLAGAPGHRARIELV